MGKEKRNGLAGEEFTAKGLEAGTMNGRLGGFGFGGAGLIRVDPWKRWLKPLEEF